MYLKKEEWRPVPVRFYALEDYSYFRIGEKIYIKIPKVVIPEDVAGGRNALYFGGLDGGENLEFILPDQNVIAIEVFGDFYRDK
jgi:hypothetical protein